MNIRKLARPAAALLAAAALMAGIPELRMEAQAAFPEYLKSVTYFGDAWPINYWGTEDDNMGANFARIKADGFNLDKFTEIFSELAGGEVSVRQYTDIETGKSYDNFFVVLGKFIKF